MSDTSSASMIDGPGKAAADFETKPFCEAELLQKHGIDASTHAWIEVSPPGGCSGRLFDLLLQYAADKCADNAPSLRPVVQGGSQSLVEELSGKKEAGARVTMTAGLGVFRFEHQHEGAAHRLVALHQRRGPVVGTDCGASTWQNLVLLCECSGPGGIRKGREVLAGLCGELVAAEEETKDKEFVIFRWDIQRQFWQRSSSKLARSVDSVVLPAATKDRVLADLDAFLTMDTYRFYIEHGIPYKRSYLFWGEPGAGKTSLIQAVAGKYRRNLCFMQPTDPRFTDDSLINAIQRAPQRSIIVLEDVDALFAKDRSANARLSITFSGLLNALDGVANPDGQIFVLTTNFRDSLDAALIRNGRVDLHVEFKHASEEQMQALFAQFYPAAGSGDAARFRDAVLAALGERRVNMAALQHYFITQRGRTPEEAIAGVASIVDDLRDKEATAADAAPDAKAKAGKEPAAPAKPAKAKGGKGSKGGRRGGSVNVYINAPSGGGAESGDGSDDE